MNRISQHRVRWLSAALLAAALVACPDTTPPVVPDTVPNGFSFTPVQTANTVQEATIIVAGINTATPVAVSDGGEYKINNGAFTSAPGTVKNGDQVTVRPKVAVAAGQSTTITVSIGGVTGSFNISIPQGSQAGTSGFTGDFAAVNNAVPGEGITSSIVTVSGLEAGSQALASVSKGLMLVGSSTSGVSSASVKNGDSIKLVVQAANTLNTPSEDAVLTLAGSSATKTFKVKTGVLGTLINLPLAGTIPSTGSVVADTSPTCITNDPARAGLFLEGPGTLFDVATDFALYPARKRIPGQTLLDGTVLGPNDYWWEKADGTLLPATNPGVASLPSYTALFGPGYTWNPTNPWANTKIKDTWQICPPAGQFQKGVTEIKFGLAQANVERAGKVVLEVVLEHGYRGDVVMTLVAPNGRQAVVFDLPDKGVASPQDLPSGTSAGIAVRFDDDATINAANKTVDVDVRCSFFNASTPTTDAGNCWNNFDTGGGWKYKDTLPAVVNSKGSTLTGLRGVPISGVWTLRIEDLFPGNYEQSDAHWPEGKGPKQTKTAKLWRANLSVQPIKAP